MASSSIQYGYGPLNQNPDLAAYPPAPIYSSASANYARLCVLVIDVGTRATEQKVLENLPESQTLTQALDEKMEELWGMNIISETQLDILYPDNDEVVETDKIDLTLWVILLRNITADAKKIKKKWQEKPEYWHQQYWHNIQRLKVIRNQLAHPGNKAELDEETFQQMWQEAEYALLRLGVQESTITTYREGNIDPERVRDAVRKLKAGNRKRYAFCSTVNAIILLIVIAGIVVGLMQLNHGCAKHIRHMENEKIRYLTRKGWGARKPKPMDHRVLPVEYVIISHTPQLPSPCHHMDDCCARLRGIQERDMDVTGTPDIIYNYVIDLTGMVYIGRSPEYIGDTTVGWDDRSVSVGLDGMYTFGPMKSTEMFQTLKAYLEYLVKDGVITPDFTIYGLCQLDSTYPYSPGVVVLDGLKHVFPSHWKPDNLTNCNMQRINPQSGDL